MKKILIAVDFSEASLNALKYAVAYTAKQKGELNVMTVYNTMSYSPMLILGTISNGLPDESMALKNKLEKLVATACKNTSIKYKVYCMVGIPEIEIQKFSRKLKTQLIIMGQTGSGGLKKFLLGSTTSHVVNTSSIPVLIIPGKYKFKVFKKIVFASDLDQKNISFMKDVIEYARYFNSMLTVLYIDTEGGYDFEKKIQLMQSALVKRYNYKKIKGVILSDINVQVGLNEYILNHGSDLIILAKYHPSLSGILTTKTSSAKLADSLSVPVLVLESKK